MPYYISCRARHTHLLPSSRPSLLSPDVWNGPVRVIRVGTNKLAMIEGTALVLTTPMPSNQSQCFCSAATLALLHWQGRSTYSFVLEFSVLEAG